MAVKVIDINHIDHRPHNMEARRMQTVRHQRKLNQSLKTWDVCCYVVGGEVIRDGAAATQKPSSWEGCHLLRHRQGRRQALYLHGVHARGEWESLPATILYPTPTNPHCSWTDLGDPCNISQVLKFLYYDMYVMCGWTSHVWVHTYLNTAYNSFAVYTSDVAVYWFVED